MVEKPISGDEEQRRAQTRAARIQSGLEPDDESDGTISPDRDSEQRQDDRQQKKSKVRR